MLAHVGNQVGHPEQTAMQHRVSRYNRFDKGQPANKIKASAQC
jgi:hypothetical protein